MVVYCRAVWDDGKAKQGDDSNEEGFMNLGKLVGMSQRRGTSLGGYG
jgi:hypothetical protein